MNKLKLISMTDVQSAKDSREFYGVEFQSIDNPFAPTCKRNFWQASVGVWKGANPDVIKPMLGKTIDGYIVTKQVVPYMIGDKEVSTYTAVILAGELESKVFKALGHELADTATVATTVSAPELAEA